MLPDTMTQSIKSPLSISRIQTLRHTHIHTHRHKRTHTHEKMPPCMVGDEKGEMGYRRRGEKDNEKKK